MQPAKFAYGSTHTSATRKTSSNVQLVAQKVCPKSFTWIRPHGKSSGLLLIIKSETGQLVNCHTRELPAASWSILIGKVYELGPSRRNRRLSHSSSCLTLCDDPASESWYLYWRTSQRPWRLRKQGIYQIWILVHHSLNRLRFCQWQSRMYI